jgi:hypothetical protein
VYLCISADRVLTVSLSIASFVDRDMVIRQFGSGIGHVDLAACQRNNDEGSDLGSESDSDAMESTLVSPCQRQASDSENAPMESEENDSDLDMEDSLDGHSSSDSDTPSTRCSSGSDSDELSELDDDGYASF